MATRRLLSHSDWLPESYPEIRQPSLCATRSSAQGKPVIVNSTRQESQRCDPELSRWGIRRSPQEVCATSLRSLFSSGIRDGVAIRLAFQAAGKREVTRK